jgi:hypothetical protein
MVTRSVATLPRKYWRRSARRPRLRSSCYPLGSQNNAPIILIIHYWSHSSPTVHCATANVVLA